MHFNEEGFLALAPDLALKAAVVVVFMVLGCMGFVALDYSKKFGLLFKISFPVACLLHLFFMID